MAVSAAIALAGLGYAIYQGAEKKKAADKAAANKMPEYQIPQEEQDNLRLAESVANQGMSTGARNAYQSAADRGLTSTNNAILRGGGDANAIGGAYDRYNEGITNMSLYDDKMRNEHLQNLMTQNSRMGAFRDKQYQVNDYGQWANRAQALNQQMAAAQQGQTAGFNTALSGLAGVGAGMANSGDKNPSYNWQNPHTASPTQLPMSTQYGGGNNFQPSYAQQPAMNMDTGNGGGWQPTRMSGDSGNTDPNYSGYKPFYDISPTDNGGWNGGMFQR